jgi:hypothetical protein
LSVGKTIEFGVMQASEQRAGSCGLPRGQQVVPDPGPVFWYYYIAPAQSPPALLVRLPIPSGASEIDAVSAARKAIDSNTW